MTALHQLAAGAGTGTDRAAGEQPGPVLSVRRLAISFGPVRALDGIDLSIMPGEVVALAGENGAGKTTLLRALAGDVRPSAGEIMLLGKLLPADPIAVSKYGVGVVW